MHIITIIEKIAKGWKDREECYMGIFDGRTGKEETLSLSYHLKNKLKLILRNFFGEDRSCISLLTEG